MRCKNCNRTFGPKALSHHSKVCTPDRPFKPLNRSVGRAGAGDSQPVGASGGAGYNLDNIPEYMDEGPQVTMVPCAKCGRKFGENRIAKHQKVCKVNSKPKKVKHFHKPVEKASDGKPGWRDKHADLKAVRLL